jgi:hypothetical protein
MSFFALFIPHRNVAHAVLGYRTNIWIALDEEQQVLGNRGSVAIEHVLQLASVRKYLLEQFEMIRKPVAVLEANKIFVRYQTSTCK